MTLAPFRNEPTLDFSEPNSRRDFEKSLKDVRARLGGDLSLIHI